ncbi:MAG TPA: hypothetical protein VN764_07530 [Polyangiaceae bacterium]|nr:hypothetical protein [Polyangiaceae bacterium]
MYILRASSRTLVLGAFAVATFGINNAGCSPACGETCGDDGPASGGSSDSSSGGGDGSGGGLTSSGAGGEDSGSDPAAAGGAAVQSDEPVIEFQIASLRSSGPSGQATLQVRSVDTTGTTCTERSAGACSLSTCDNQSESDPTAGFPRVGHVEATIEEDAVISSAVVDVDGSERSSSAAFSPSLFLTGEERIQLDVRGGDLGPLSREVQLPLYLITTNPLSDDSAEEPDVDYVELSRSQGLLLTWERGVSGFSYHVQGSTLSTEDPEGPRTWLNCAFPSTDGQGFIDPSLLGTFEPNDEFLTLGVFDDVSDWGDYQARVRLVVNTVTPAKDQAVTLRLVE